MMVVSDLAIAAGAASIPGPVTDSDDDGWFVWVPCMSQFQFVSGVGIDPDAGRYFPFDSRAMRRTEEGFGIAVMWETGSADGVQVEFAASLYATRN